MQKSKRGPSPCRRERGKAQDDDGLTFCSRIVERIESCCRTKKRRPKGGSLQEQKQIQKRPPRSTPSEGKRATPRQIARGKNSRVPFAYSGQDGGRYESESGRSPFGISGDATVGLRAYSFRSCGVNPGDHSMGRSVPDEVPSGCFCCEQPHPHPRALMVIGLPYVHWR